MHERLGMSWLAMRLSVSQDGFWCVKWNLLVRSTVSGRNEIAMFRRLFLPPSSRHSDKGDRPRWSRCIDSCEGFVSRASPVELVTRRVGPPAPSSLYNTSSIEWTGSWTQFHLCALHVEMRLFVRRSRFAFSFQSVSNCFVGPLGFWGIRKFPGRISARLLLILSSY
jgi:hypothetical protein